MSKKERFKKAKNALGGIGALALFGSNYSTYTTTVSNYVYSFYTKGLEVLSNYTGLPTDILNVIVVITLAYISLKLAANSVKTLVIISWIIVIILISLNILFGFKLGA